MFTKKLISVKSHSTFVTLDASENRKEMVLHSFPLDVTAGTFARLIMTHAGSSSG